MFSLGYQEILLIAVVALVVISPDRLPEFLRSAGRMTAKVRRAATELQREINSVADDVSAIGVGSPADAGSPTGAGGPASSGGPAGAGGPASAGSATGAPRAGERVARSKPKTSLDADSVRDDDGSVSR
jgi:Tat protein translocase TatB subunit